METSDVRRQVRQAIERARRGASERRARIDAAAKDYQSFLSQTAVPVFRQVASALAAEGYHFKVYTPADSVRLVSDRSGDDFVELTLDTAGGTASVVFRSSRRFGRDLQMGEQPLREGAAIDRLTDQDVLDRLVAEIERFVER
jgi:hypothetical protein